MRRQQDSAFGDKDLKPYLLTAFYVVSLQISHHYICLILLGFPLSHYLGVPIPQGRNQL